MDNLLELAQLAALPLVIIAFIGGVVYVARMEKIAWTGCAERFGLAYTRQKPGGGRSLNVLEGTFEGIPIRVVGMYQTVGNVKRHGTQVFGQAQFPSPHRFAVQIERGGNRAPAYHNVPTGDPDFDRSITIKSDSPDTVRAFVDPAMRAAILELPLKLKEASVVYDAGALSLSYAGEPDGRAMLDASVLLMLAAARTRLA